MEISFFKGDCGCLPCHTTCAQHVFNCIHAQLTQRAAARPREAVAAGSHLSTASASHLRSRSPGPGIYVSSLCVVTLQRVGYMHDGWWRRLAARLEHDAVDAFSRNFVRVRSLMNACLSCSKRTTQLQTFRCITAPSPGVLHHYTL